MPRSSAAASPELSLPSYRTRRSSIHGTGVIATRRIQKGEIVDEYLGARITHAEANRRYSAQHASDGHTFLFTLNSRTVIDGSVGGNDIRFINHSCEPNCAPRFVKGRIFIVAVRSVLPGEELGMEYNIAREDDDPPNVDSLYACYCGTAQCRGTMLWPPSRGAEGPAEVI